MNNPEKTLDLQVSLTPGEVDALKQALDHVRVHMAHEHPWAVRDAAMTAIGKVIAATKKHEALSDKHAASAVRGSCLACLMPVDVTDGAVIAHPGPKGSVYEPRCVGTDHPPFRRTR